jgi:hypothetical protein
MRPNRTTPFVDRGKSSTAFLHFPSLKIIISSAPITMKGISFLAVLLATQSAKRALADYHSYCPVSFDSATATDSGSGLRCNALVRSVTAAAVAPNARYDAARWRFSFAPCRFHLTQCVHCLPPFARCSCTCYLFCGNEFRSCYSGADDNGDDVAAWRSTCDEPLACSVVKVQTRRFLHRPAMGRKATEGWEYVHALRCLPC